MCESVKVAVIVIQLSTRATVESGDVLFTKRIKKKQQRGLEGTELTWCLKELLFQKQFFVEIFYLHFEIHKYFR